MFLKVFSTFPKKFVRVRRRSLFWRYCCAFSMTVCHWVGVSFHFTVISTGRFRNESWRDQLSYFFELCPALLKSSLQFCFYSAPTHIYKKVMDLRKGKSQSYLCLHFSFTHTSKLNKSKWPKFIDMSSIWHCGVLKFQVDISRQYIYMQTLVYC